MKTEKCNFTIEELRNANKLYNFLNKRMGKITYEDLVKQLKLEKL